MSANKTVIPSATKQRYLVALLNIQVAWFYSAKCFKTPQYSWMYELSLWKENNNTQTIPISKLHGANMGPIWGRQDPGGPHVGPMNFVIWDSVS